jgi:MFS family permease
VKLLIYLSVFMAVGYGYLLTIIAAYLPEAGITSTQVGLIMGTSGLTMVVVAVPLGLLSDRLGRKRILVVSMLLLVPVLFVFGITLDFTALLAASVLGGVAEGAFMSSWNAMIADMTTLENRDESFVMSFIVNGGAMAVGSGLPLVFPLFEGLGFGTGTVHSLAFIVLGALVLISPIMTVRLLHEHREDGVRSPMIQKGRNLNRMLKFSGCNALIGLGAGLIIPLVPTWLWLKYGVPDTYSGPLLAVVGITIGLAALLSARLGRRLGSVRAIVLCQATSTIFMVLIPLVPGAALAASVYVVRAILMNMSGPLADSYLMSIISKEERGLASAINNIVWRLPNSVTTFVGGALLAAGVFDLPFFLAGLFYIVAIMSFFVLFRNVKPYS